MSWFFSACSLQISLYTSCPRGGAGAWPLTLHWTHPQEAPQEQRNLGHVSPLCSSQVAMSPFLSLCKVALSMQSLSRVWGSLPGWVPPGPACYQVPLLITPGCSSSFFFTLDALFPLGKPQETLSSLPADAIAASYQKLSGYSLKGNVTS